MSRGREAGDRFRTGSVGGAIGAAAFDGNRTSDVEGWMVPSDWREEHVTQMIEELMDYTIRGHLAWVVFPPQGYRL